MVETWFWVVCRELLSCSLELYNHVLTFLVYNIIVSWNSEAKAVLADLPCYGTLILFSSHSGMIGPQCPLCWTTSLTSPQPGTSIGCTKSRLRGWGMSAKRGHYSWRQKGAWLEWEWGLRCRTPTMMSMTIPMIHRMLEQQIMTQQTNSSLSNGKCSGTMGLKFLTLHSDLPIKDFQNKGTSLLPLVPAASIEKCLWNRQSLIRTIHIILWYQYNITVGASVEQYRISDARCIMIKS